MKMDVLTAETCRHALIKVVVTHYCGILLCIDVNKYLYTLLLCHTMGWPPLSLLHVQVFLRMNTWMFEISRHSLNKSCSYSLLWNIY